MNWGIRAAIEYAVIAAAFAMATAYPNPGTWVLATLIIGTRQHALMIIGHMAAHGYAGKHSQLLQFICMAPLGIDTDEYKQFHFDHHRNLGDPIKDPEAWFVSHYKDRYTQYKLKHTIYDLLGFHADEAADLAISMATAESFMGFALLTGGLYLLIGWTALLWPISMMTVLVAANRLRSRTEHDHINEPGITFYQTKPNIIKRLLYLPHGTWRHMEHHERWHEA